MKQYAAPARVLVAGVTCLLLLGGCTSDSDSGGPKPSKSASASTLDTSAISPQDLPTPPTVAKAKGAVAALKLGKCALAPGKQTVKGTIASTAKSTTDYLVVVNWSTDTGDVMGRGYTVLKNVKPAEKRKLAITAKVADGAKKCVPFVQYGNVRK